MIRTDRLHIIPLSYEQLVSRVYSFSGMIDSVEHQENFIKYALEPMKKAPVKLHLWYTSWIAYFEGNEVLECGFICPPTEQQVVEVFCYTKAKYQKQGFGTEAIKGLVRFASAFNNIKYVCASVDKDNKPSQKMLEKSGFYYLSDSPTGMKVFNQIIKN